MSGALAIMRAAPTGEVPTPAIRRRMLVDASSTATTAFAGLALGFERANSWNPFTRASGRRQIAASLRDLAEAGVAAYAFFDADRRAHARNPIPDLRHFGVAGEMLRERSAGRAAFPEGKPTTYGGGDRRVEEVILSPFPVKHVRDVWIGDSVAEFRAGDRAEPVVIEFPGAMTHADAARLARLHERNRLFPDGAPTFTEEEVYAWNPTEAGSFPDAEGHVAPNRGPAVPGDEGREIERLAASFGDRDALAAVRSAGLQSDGLSPT